MTFILYLYIIGVVLTGLYIAIQLILELPQDVKRFKEYQKESKIDSEDSVVWFVGETLLVAIALSLLWPLFWFLEITRIRR